MLETLEKKITSKHRQIDFIYDIYAYKSTLIRYHLLQDNSCVKLFLITRKALN